MDLRRAMTAQAKACEALGSAFTGRLLRLAAARLQPGGPVADRLLSWQGDLGPGAQSVPLRLAGTLHGLVLSGAAPALKAAYPPHEVADDQLWLAVQDTLASCTPQAMQWLDSPPQTNEVRRAAALIAAGHWLADRCPMPLMVSELGASGGLNLMWDRFALDLPEGRRGPQQPAMTLTPEWRGDLPPVARPLVAERRGVDLNPLAPSDPADALRLRAYIWPDQADRLARTTAAIAVAEAPVDRADAVAWLPDRLAAQPSGQLHMIYHTIAWQYLPPRARAKGDALIARAGAQATPDRPLARFEMEADGQKHSAALRMTLWPGGETRSMGRADFHGRWIDWRNG